jgi:hypothetical protein
VHVRGQGVDGIKDALRDSTRLVDDHEHIAGVDPLEGSLVVVGRLAPVGDQLLADVPLGVERDPPWQDAGAVGSADVPPKDRLDLGGRWCGGDDERLARWVDVDPPTSEA